MKKRLISLCLALAFVLAALPGNLVSLAADSIGDLAGDEAAGVWGDFSDWVVMEETASFKTDSATLYYNPGTQPNSTVTLTGDDVPASFRVEYMLPLTAADGTVSYWYVLNTEEWDAFAGADVCPPYVRVEDVTDLTYLEVQGAADGVSAEFEKVDASTAPEEVDTSHMSGVTSIRGYDISLKDENGATWQPKDNGTTVTVRVYDAWDITVENPIVDIYHVHGDGTVEVLSNTNGAVTLWPDGSVSFETDSFSVYYVVAGTSKGSSDNDTTIRDLPSENSTYYVEPGTTIVFTSGSFNGNGTTGITRSNRTITVALDAVIGTRTSFTVSGKTLTFVVSDRTTVIEGAITNHPVYLGLLTSGGDGIPSEPGVSDGDYNRYNSSYTANSLWQWEEYTFADTAEGIISADIADYMIVSVDGSSTVGIYDATGVTTLSYLSKIDWNIMLERAVSARAYATDGIRVTSTNKGNYVVIPYVVKLMAEKGIGWHIDCAVVPKSRVTLSYDLNLKNYVVEGTTLTLPSAVTQVGKVETNIGYIKKGNSNLAVGAELDAKLGNENYDVKFLGWSTDPNATTAQYASGDPISVTEDTVLYAVWSGKAETMTIYYSVVGPIGSGTVRPQSETLNTSVSAANGSAVTVNPGYQFVGWYDNADCNGDPVSTSITFKPEKPADGWPMATYYYAKVEEIKVTINYVIVGPDGTQYTANQAWAELSDYSQTVGAVNGTPSSTAKVLSNVYKFVGWYSDDKCENQLSTAATYVPTKGADELWVDGTTYYAKFEYNLTSLTISKTGWESIDPNQTFIFNVNGNGVNLDVTVHGNGSVTIDGLTVGAQYTITEKTDWSWRYQCSGWTHTNGGNGSSNVASITLGLNGTITFTNTRPNEQWLDGDSWCDNRFN